MKKKTHPLYDNAKISCTCNKIWNIKSTIPQIKISICANCHPLFTGQKKFIDIEGRIEKFNKKYKLKTSN